MELKILVIFAVFLTGCCCSKILVVYPTISKSHVIPLQSLTLALAKKGHEITFISPFPLNQKIPNYREFEVSLDEPDKEFFTLVMKSQGAMGIITTFPMMLSKFFDLQHKTLQSKEMRKLMDEESFDLVIFGYVFTEGMLGLADHFKCPSIVFCPMIQMSLINQLVGNPLGVSGTPNLFIQGQEMNFINRVKNFLITTLEVAGTRYINYKTRQVYDTNFPQDRYRSYDESVRNLSLILSNNHFSSGYPRPLLPNLVEVGGVQVKPEAEPLPEKLKIFLDEATDGAILFSLGTNAKSTFLSKEVLSTILKVFASLKQRVVMKWEADSLDGKPDNVFISKWLPQDDVLAHPNIKAFISHCGLGGVVEAKYHSVPIIGLPLFGDQPGNAVNVEKEGWGIILEMESITEESLGEAIREILVNPKYFNAVKKLSDLTRDRPMNAQDTAVYWVEYVLRHRGAPHMHYPGADLNLLQYNSIDVIAFLLAICYATIKLIKFVIKKVCCRKHQQKTKQKIN